MGGRTKEAARWLAACAILVAASGARAEGAGVLTVRFAELEELRGVVIFSLADSRERFESEEETLHVAEVPASEKAVVAVFEGVAPGEYAVKVFQDANTNRKLDIGMLGPKEKFGFSNDVMGFMGPPDFDDAKFRFDGTELTVEIEAR